MTDETKNPVGRPPMFKTVEELQAKIDSYFKSLIKEDKDGNEYTKPATITGLAYHLGFIDRSSFYNYEDKQEFTYTVKRARLFIESLYEEGLQSRSAGGCIFALKNFGWKDKTETEVTATHTINTATFVDMDDMPNDEPKQ